MRMDKSSRVGRRALAALLDRIGERDKALLQSLSDYRHLLTSQIQRLYFRKSLSTLAALRSTNRCLRRLEESGLVATLKRRIGGVRAGSSSYVWTLTPVGHRLLDLLARQAAYRTGSDDGGDAGKSARKRSHEPSPAFLQHTLAVAEVAIRLSELAFSRKIGLSERQVEPACWRSYTNAGGSLSTLRPDLFAITATCGSDYEDHWFIEVDLATESPAVVVRKCKQYLAYLDSGEEQKRYGVFPLVVWIVPDTRRKQSLLAHIADNLPNDGRLFVVIALDELERLVLGGGTTMGVSTDTNG